MKNSKLLKKIPKDTRVKLWANLEADIQKRSKKKDKTLRLDGPWKKFMRKSGNFDVYRVDGEWVRTNLSVIFGHGGHGRVHEFIPHNEIWIDTHHVDCRCKNVAKNRRISQLYTDSTILHEITEYKEMGKGKIFWEAHNLALEAERKAKILKDPYTEDYE